MNLKTTLSAGLGTLSLIAGSLFMAQPASAAEVVISDPKLRACTMQAISWQPLTSITEEQAQSVRRLRCAGVSSLQGIEKLTNLEQLSIQEASELTDLKPLSDLTNLTDLTINNSNISDFYPLATIQSLISVTFIRGNIKDVSPFSMLSSLSNLDLAVNEIVDFRPFKPLVERKTKIRASYQMISLPAIKVGEVQFNPVIGVDDEPMNIRRGGGIEEREGIVLDPSNKSWYYTRVNPVNKISVMSERGDYDEYKDFMVLIDRPSLELPSPLKDDSASTDYQTPVTVDVLANDGLAYESSWLPETLSLLDAQEAPVSSLALEGGSFEVANGQITFAPANGFSGQVPAVRYQVTNERGISSTATLTINVNAAPEIVTPPTTTEPETAEPGSEQPGTTVAPAGSNKGSNEGHNSTSVSNTGQDNELASTGTSTNPPLAIAGLLLIAGISIALLNRRRKA